CRAHRRKAHRGGREARRKSDRIRRRGSKDSSDLRGGPGQSRRALPHGLHGSLVYAEGKSQRVTETNGIVEYWNIGVMAKRDRLSIPLFHYSIIPTFQYST